jgi:DNA ligase D-like protein (predicted ligase)
MARPLAHRRSPAAALPEWIPPQLSQLVEAAPDGDDWLHEIKFDGYRMHARLDRGGVRLLTRTGLDWTHKYPPIAAAVSSLGARQAYLDGELCGVFPDGITSFSMIQAASDAGNAAGLVYFIFDLLHLDGEDIGALPVIERKARLAELLSGAAPPLHYSDYHRGRGPAFHEQACRLELEGIVSKRADAAYAPGNRGLWLKVKCLYREEFVVVGWTDPEGRRPWLGALLLAYYDPDGRLVYAGRAGTGIKQAELERLWRRLQPLTTDRMPLDVPPPAAAASAHRWCSAARIGCGPNWWPMSSFSPGPTTTSCGRWCTRACARTSRRARCSGKCHGRNPSLTENRRHRPLCEFSAKAI